MDILVNDPLNQDIKYKHKTECRNTNSLGNLKGHEDSLHLHGQLLVPAKHPPLIWQRNRYIVA